MVNSRGQNVLHVAVLKKSKKVVKYLFKNKNCRSLLYEPDNDGNTPFYLYIASKGYKPTAAYWNPRALKLSGGKEDHTRVDVSNKEIQEDELDPVYEKRVDNIMKTVQMHLVVATLVMTVTFAAGFTLPGGFDSDAGLNKGMAILTRNAAFRAFVVMDAIAFTLSAGAVFIYYSLAFLIDETKPTFRLWDVTDTLYIVAGLMQFFAMLAVVIAFVTGMYATLQHLAGLAVTVCIIGCTTFPVFFWVLIQVLET